MVGYKRSGQGNGKRGSLTMGERCQYRRRDEGKIRIKMSEDVIRNHTINYLSFQITTHTILYINIHSFTYLFTSGVVMLSQ